LRLTRSFCLRDFCATFAKYSWVWRRSVFRGASVSSRFRFARLPTKYS
jgi:hypothetical protein